MKKVENISAKGEEKAVSNTLSEKEATHKPFKRVMRVQFDIEYGGSHGKIMDSKSETMPDMNITVKQLLENHSIGKQAGKVEVRQPLYFETEIPTLNDITDVGEFKKSLEERLKNVNAYIKAEKDLKAKKKTEDKAKKEAEKAAKTEANKVEKEMENPPINPKTGQTFIPH